MHTADNGSHVCVWGGGGGSGVHQKAITEGHSQPEGHSSRPYQKATLEGNIYEVIFQTYLTDI